MPNVLTTIFGSKHEREMRKVQPIVDLVNRMEPEVRRRSDHQLRARTMEIREQLEAERDDKRRKAMLDGHLVEVFAMVREAAIRSIGQRHYDVQLIGGIVLHQGKIAEMKTGEGKTLVATLPMVLNALEGRGTHLVTVNDYLAKRDAEWMGQVYGFLGLTTGVIVHDLNDRQRQKSYRSDITYGTNNEFGFDYLRDNMKESIERYVQQDLHYAIVDEVDSILIDEARTPLIISGPAEQAADLYLKVNAIIPSLKKDVDFTVDEKAHSAILTDSGVERVEARLGIGNLYDPRNLDWLHHVNTALKAHTLYKRDVNYLIEGGKVIIIDEFTGRKMEGRRWSDGLHQAVEAKENLKVEEENQTLATVTFQNYFRMYKKLAGMTGTADTEAEEFHKIYKLEVVVIPTNVPVTRLDADDTIYKSEKGKLKAIVAELRDCHERGQPVLVGTVSVEKTEVISKLLKGAKIPHEVLNAKNHGREALIVAQAGRPGSITISTNMAGRGTDIHLGGNAEYLAREEADPIAQPERYEEVLEESRSKCARDKLRVIEAGGLHILGTERHESRRIDNQLRGRAGRQGDPGSSRFFLSLEDDLMRIFGGDRLRGMMDRLGMTEDEPIEHRWVNKAIESSQRKVEGQNFDIRKNLLEYDDVMNLQRKSIYTLRKQVLEGRYSRELTEEEKRAGKEPEVPKESGDWTVESLSERAKPRVQAVVDHFFKKEVVTEGGETHVEEAKEVEPERITNELYRYFGAMVDLRRHRRSPEECVETATREIAGSLIQQRERILDLAEDLLQSQIDEYMPESRHMEEWDVSGLLDMVKTTFGFEPELEEAARVDRALVGEQLWEQIEKSMERREAAMGPIAFLYFCRHFYLDEIDDQWIEHLKAMDHLREGIGLRGYAQRDPKLEYKREGFDMFAEMMVRIKKNVAAKIFRVQVQKEEEDLPEFEHKKRRMQLQHASGGGLGGSPQQGGATKPKTVRRKARKINRNELCPCGSGKKYKQCHLAKDEEAARRGEDPEWLERAS
ncbi:MAG: preprotein translocase subunit SecA [Polyangia bacterium]|jgi:preprotein translocase subunit SecA|nr:preprotein translocase subunit SecA [Polyangia bacterium]